MLHILLLDGSLSPVHLKTVGVSGMLYRPVVVSQLFVTASSPALRLIGESRLIAGGSTVSYINPQSDAEWELTVKDKAGVSILDATVTAMVYNPKGVKVGDNVSMSHAGSGKYILTIMATWSESAGLPVEGEYVIIATVLRSGVKRTKRFRYVVRTDDQD